MRKKLIALIAAGVLILSATIFRAWSLLNDRLLGIEMDYNDFCKWIHNDLRGIHDHLDEPVRKHVDVKVWHNEQERRVQIVCSCGGIWYLQSSAEIKTCPHCDGIIDTIKKG